MRSKMASSDELISVSLPPNYNYLIEECEYELDTKWKALLRIKGIVNQREIKKWLREFEDVSYITWKVARTYPRTGKLNVFREDYRCHHNVRKKPVSCRASKHTACPAFIKVTIRRSDKRRIRMKKPDPLMFEWPCIVELCNIHNHSLTSDTALRHRPISSPVLDQLAELFDKGHSPSTAHDSIKLDYLLNQPEDYRRFIRDRHFLPPKSDCYKQYYKHAKSNCREPHKHDIFNELGKVMSTYYGKNPDSKIEVDVTAGGSIVVCLLTSIMCRAHHHMKQASEIVVLDTILSDRQKCYIHLFLTPSGGGGIPLACLVTDSDTEATFESGLTLLERCLPPGAFYQRGAPRVLLADPQKETALQRRFPHSKVVLGKFHVLRSLWRFLFDSRKAIKREDRLKVYVLFKETMFSSTLEKLDGNFQRLSEFVASGNYGMLQKYLKKLWLKREKWASAFTVMLPILGSAFSSTEVETKFLLLEEFMPERIRSFNIASLLDMLLTKLDDFVRQRLVDCISGVTHAFQNANQMLKTRSTIQGSELTVFEYEHECVHMEVLGESEGPFHIDMAVNVCSCQKERLGFLCCHLLIVKRSIQRDPQCTLSTKLNAQQKRILLNVATDRISLLNKEDIRTDHDYQMLIENAAENAGVEEHMLAFNQDDQNLQKNTDLDRDDCNEIMNHDCEVVHQVAGEQVIKTEQNEPNSEHDTEHSLTTSKGKENALSHLREIFLKIEDGIARNSAVFVPSVLQMHRNTFRLLDGDEELASAMKLFGKG